MSVPQSTSYTVSIKMFLASDHVSPATGKTVAIVLSKAGGAFANPSGGATNATEISNGWYFVTLSTTDSNTIGDLIVRGTASGCDDGERIVQVVSATTGGATNLDAAVSSRSTYAGGAVASVTAAVTVGGYSTGQDPATLLAAHTPTVRNQDAITAPNFDDCLIGAWCRAFGKETENDTAATYVMQKPDNSAAIRSFTLTVDTNHNPTARS